MWIDRWQHICHFRSINSHWLISSINSATHNIIAFDYTAMFMWCGLLIQSSLADSSLAAFAALENYGL
jgi:hypothetical protein